MGLFTNQLANVVEWPNFEEDMLFYKWSNDEIKKGSKLILRPGQSAIFLYNGIMEGKFDEPGNFDIESDILPFLSTLKGFKFGFNSGLRAEVLFINTREVMDKWGTQQPINLPYPGMPGGLPIRANGTFTVQIRDYMHIVNNIAGLPVIYRASDLRDRVLNALEPSMVSVISREGTDLFNLQANAREIAEHIEKEMAPELEKSGIGLADFTIRQVSYPKEIQDRINQNAGVAMFSDTAKLQQVAFADGMAKGNAGTDAAAVMMGMMMGQQTAGNTVNAQTASAPTGNGTAPKFCPECGTPTNGAKFCSNCGTKLI